jgi:molybdopterin synthase catalytic subunit
MTIYARVTTDEISLEDALARVKSPDHGAIDLFVGVVRNNHNGKEVSGMTYDAHEKLAEKSFIGICREAMGFWPETRHAVLHYKGELPVGGTSIVIAVSSPHRAESFEACRYVIEEIKMRAPIWKREHYLEGKSEWLPGHSLRYDAEYAVEPCCGKCCGGKHV